MAGTTAPANGTITMQRSDNGAIRVVMTGSIDMATCESSPLDDLDSSRVHGDIAVDVSRVDFMDSVGLTVLLRLRHLTTGVVRLIAPSAAVLRTLRTSGTGDLFDIRSQASTDSSYN